jgi:chromosomal replication initiator protein
MQAWEQFLQQQEAELGKEIVAKWLRSLKVKHFDACNLYLEAENSFQALWFEEHIRGKVQKQLINGNHRLIKVHLTVPERMGFEKEKILPTKKPILNAFKLDFDQLSPIFHFNNYVFGQKDQLSCSILKGIESNYSEESFNPIYIYGPPGCGKTHLLIALYHAWIAKGLKIIYARAETFTEHVIKAIRESQMSLFRQTYRNVDALLIDDVHLFSRKNATQEEFFHTFNTLHLANKKIILTSACPPKDLQYIEPRLISRFEWGISLSLEPLSEKEIPAILQEKAKALNLNLPEPLSTFLISTFKSNPKAIVKALEALALRLHLNASSSLDNLSISTAEKLLADLIEEEEKNVLTSEKIIQLTAEHYGIRQEDILSKAQRKECALPRQLAMTFCRKNLKMPFMKIGELFNRDHSTVMTSVKQVDKALNERLPDIYEAWQAIQKKF